MLREDYRKQGHDMADDSGEQQTDPTQELVKHLEDGGFFSQIGDLEKNLKVIADQLQAFGDVVSSRMSETENLAAHVLAIEAVLAAMLREHPVDAEKLKTEVIRRTADISGNPEGSPAVHEIVAELSVQATD